MAEGRRKQYYAETEIRESQDMGLTMNVIRKLAVLFNMDVYDDIINLLIQFLRSTRI